MRASGYTLIACLAAAGCATNQPGSSTERQGVAELQLDAASLQAAFVTRVTVEAAGQTQELAFNPLTATYDAALLLPAGSQVLIGRAFSNDVLIGASNPVSVEVTQGNVSRVLLRILDLRADAPPMFGPLFDSLTFPTTVSAGAPATFALSVIAPAHDPVIYQWTSDCADSAFTAPDAPTTAWSKPTAGSCRIDVTAASNGFSIRQNFVIVVFPEGSDGGAVNVSGVFVGKPRLSLNLGDSCSQTSESFENASCATTVAAPGTLPYTLSAFDGGLSALASVELSDNCGGRSGSRSLSASFVQGNWMPPAAGGLCIVTGRAINSDGVAATLSFAVLTRPGTIPATHAPTVSAQLNFCNFSTELSDQNCTVPANERAGLSVRVEWQDGLPGSVVVHDDCGGGQFPANDSFFFFRAWTPSSPAGTTCHLTVDVANLQGVKSAASLTYQLL